MASSKEVCIFLAGAACGAATVSLLAVRSADLTARGAATKRAMGHSMEAEDSGRRNPDDLARLFVSPALLRVSQLLLQTGLAPPHLRYGSMTARTKFCDQVVLESVDAFGPNCQLVVLGAGFDSRSLRFKSQLESAHVVTFEVDRRIVLNAKRERLEAAKVKPNPLVRYVDFNFNTEPGEASLISSLVAAGYRTDTKTLFLLEGVTYYLDPHVLDNLLMELQAGSCPGSRLAFDYLFQSVLDGTCTAPAAKGWKASLARTGNDVRTGIDPGTLSDMRLP
eukprot:scaffold1206_cov388-Prasinococcus_capsulatus_cf.AAC.31